MANRRRSDNCNWVFDKMLSSCALVSDLVSSDCREDESGGSESSDCKMGFWTTSGEDFIAAFSELVKRKE